MKEIQENKSPEMQRQEMRRRRRRKRRLQQLAVELGALALLVTVIAVPIWLLCRPKKAQTEPQRPELPEVSAPAEEEGPKIEPYPEITDETEDFSSEVDAQQAFLLDVTDNTVVASRQGHKRVYPASITKVMTLLVAVEHIEDYTATVKMPYTVLNDLYQQGATVAGFKAGEEVTITDLLYGCILPSGADATWALAYHVAGTEENFAKLMNEKAAQLGMADTHFVNSSGLHDKNHYTSAADMAVLMRETMKNPLCRKVLGTYQYTTASTPENPEGLLLTSTMFSRMKGDEPETALVIAGKTGYTGQALHTMVSYAEGENGHDYILVTMGGSNRWAATYDAIKVYKKYGADPDKPAPTVSTP